MLHKALRETRHLWPSVRKAYQWVYAVARILDNPDELSDTAVRRRLSGIVGAMQRWQSLAGKLQPAVAHFLKVTRSYWPGLFHCYAVPDLPRTNNDLEHLFGRSRHLERRITGRKTTSRSLVLRGTVRLVAAVATQQRAFDPDELVPDDLQSWRQLRSQMEARCYQRRRQLRFRRDPDAYLNELEQRLLKLTLPP